MKYIKEFKIFESLRDEYVEKLRQIETQKKIALDGIKKQVDEYMNYILDDYQTDGYDDSISDTGLGKFVIYYKNIKCKLDILEGDYKHTNWSECDEFISLLEKIFEMIEKEFEVTVNLRASFLYDVGLGGTAATINNVAKVESHNIEHGLVTTIEKLKRWIDMTKNYKKGSIPEYHTLKVEIIVR